MLRANHNERMVRVLHTTNTYEVGTTCRSSSAHAKLAAPAPPNTTKSTKKTHTYGDMQTVTFLRARLGRRPQGAKKLLYEVGEPDGVVDPPCEGSLETISLSNGHHSLFMVKALLSKTEARDDVHTVLDGEPVRNRGSETI